MTITASSRATLSPEGSLATSEPTPRMTPLDRRISESKALSTRAGSSRRQHLFQSRTGTRRISFGGAGSAHRGSRGLTVVCTPRRASAASTSPIGWVTANLEGAHGKMYLTCLSVTRHVPPRAGSPVMRVGVQHDLLTAAGRRPAGRSLQTVGPAHASLVVDLTARHLGCQARPCPKPGTRSSPIVPQACPMRCRTDFPSEILSSKVSDTWVREVTPTDFRRCGGRPAGPGIDCGALSGGGCASGRLLTGRPVAAV